MAFHLSANHPAQLTPASGAAAVCDWRTLPGEWCYSQLRDAAIEVLQAQIAALERGETVSRASTLDVQFNFNGPCLDLPAIPYYGGAWPAYTQFCRNFLAPLMLMRSNPELNPRYRWYGTDGVDLKEASSQLGLRTYLDLDALLHIHLPARIHSLRPGAFFLHSGEGWTRNTMSDLISSLIDALGRLSGPQLPARTYQDHELQRLMRIDAFLNGLRGSPPGELWVDLAGSQPADPARQRIVFLSDASAAERCYRTRDINGTRSALPFLATSTDLESAVSARLKRRAGVVTVCGALPALFRDMGSSFVRVTDLLRRLANRAVLEWIPPDDPDVRRTFDGTVPEDYRFDVLWSALHPSYEVVQIESLPYRNRRLFFLRQRPGSIVKNR